MPLHFFGVSSEGEATDGDGEKTGEVVTLWTAFLRVVRLRERGCRRGDSATKK